MQNIPTETKPKSVAAKSLTLLALILIISFIAWLSVQILAIAPSAFSSLASLTDAIGTARDEAVVEMNEPTTLSLITDKSEINNNETVTVSWEDSSEAGTYAFRYECIDGVSVTLTTNGNTRTVSCATNYDIGDITSLTVGITSTQPDTVTVPYAISFLKANTSSPAAQGGGNITVAAVVTETATSTPEVIVETPVPETPVTPSPEPEVEFVYEIPTSNPTGTPDLRATFVAIGEITGNRFVSGAVSRNDTGAIQFEVRNIGNKTSERWTFSVDLPDGTTFTSESQAPLRPNERALLSLSFITDSSTRHTFEISVETDIDRLETNNTFRQTINFQ